MKVAYIFRTNMSSTFQLATMILPQLENDLHGVDVVDMFLFDDSGFCFRMWDPVGERLSKLAQEKEILLMISDQCAVRRNLAEGMFEQCGSGDVKPKDMVDGATVGCFPQMYQALSGNMVDQVITL